MKTISKAGLDLIKHFEGLRLQSYLCPAGVWTLGYGTTRGITEGMSTTEEGAEEMLLRDLVEFERELNGILHVEIDQTQFDA